MRVTRTVPLLASAAAVAVALVPSSAGAATYKTPKVRGDMVKTPLVKIVGGEDVALTRSAARRYTRGQFRIACTDVPDDLGGTGNSSEATTTLRKGLRFTLSRQWDYCVVTLKRTDREGGTTILSLGTIAKTTQGDDYLYERGVAGIMSAVSDLTFRGPDDKPQTVPQIIAILKGSTAAGRSQTGVAIPAPRTPVAVDQIGIWTDGTRTSVTATTPAGRHLYLDYDRSTRDLSSNISAALSDTFGTEL